MMTIPEPEITGWVTIWTEGGEKVYHHDTEDPRKKGFGWEYLMDMIKWGNVEVEEQFVHHTMTVTQHNSIVAQLQEEIERLHMIIHID